MKPLKHFLLVFVLFSFMIPAWAQDDFTRHHRNFYLFSRDKEIFYPHAANVGYLMDIDLGDKEVKETIAWLASKKINTLRIVLDDGYAPGAPLEEYETNKGKLTKPHIDRLEWILQQAQRHEMASIVCLFDMHRVGTEWERHPYNKSQGGWCSKRADLFMKNESRTRAFARIEQVIDRCESYDLLGWEIAHGADMWSAVDQPTNELVYGSLLWYRKMKQEILRHDSDRLIGLTFFPNSLPNDVEVDLMNLAKMADFFFLHIRSKDPIQTAKSVDDYLRVARYLRKPVFIADTTWKGPSDQYEEFLHCLTWSAVASCSGTFYSPLEKSDGYTFPEAIFSHLPLVYEILEYLDLSGTPRPESKVSISTHPEDTFHIFDGMVGKDWFFWVLRKEPGNSRAQLGFRVIEGEYEYNWFDTGKNTHVRKKQFTQSRKELILQSPSFNRSIFGVLRLEERMQPNRD